MLCVVYTVLTLTQPRDINAGNITEQFPRNAMQVLPTVRVSGNKKIALVSKQTCGQRRATSAGPRFFAVGEGRQ